MSNNTPLACSVLAVSNDALLEFRMIMSNRARVGDDSRGRML